jgi:hypothetical protein
VRLFALLQVLLLLKRWRASTVLLVRALPPSAAARSTTRASHITPPPPPRGMHRTEPTRCPCAQVTGKNPIAALQEHLADPWGTTIFSKAVVVPGQAVQPECKVGALLCVFCVCVCGGG